LVLPRKPGRVKLGAMDLVFESQEINRYEQWLETPAGRSYVEASWALLDRVLDWRPGWRVLDVGCGLGVHLKRLQERGMLVSGLEAGPVAAGLAARRLGSKVEVEVGDAHELPYEDNSFDAVVMVNTLELVERRAQALAEASRVACSRLCVISLNSFSPAGLIWRRSGSQHPLHRGRPLSLIALWRLVREVLGPVPQNWAGALSWPSVMVGRWPFSPLLGVCAAVTPRLMTTPLIVESPASRRPAQPATVHGQVSVLHRIK
jgi:SAM-dependent methyltransferase